MNSASGVWPVVSGKNRSTVWRGPLAVGEPELGVLLRLHALAIGRGVALPAGEDFRMLRHARAVVVFGLEVNRHFGPSPRHSTADLG